jgi:hypothetical protein
VSVRSYFRLFYSANGSEILYVIRISYVRCKTGFPGTNFACSALFALLHIHN